MIRKLIIAGTFALSALNITTASQATTVLTSSPIEDIVVSAVEGEATLETVSSLLTNSIADLTEFGRADVDQATQRTTISGLQFRASTFLGRTYGGVWDTRQFEAFDDLTVLAVAAVLEGEFILFDYSAGRRRVVDNWCVDGFCSNQNPDAPGDPAQFFTRLSTVNPGFNLVDADTVNRRFDSIILFGVPTADLVNAVPEPGTWLLMLMGFGGVAVALRRRRNSALAA